ncbi:unnamed protein product [Thelazia callipaeda]|uniref:Coatomer subunit zeta n=1 Tax=Thelazia callipaeda TaxID=103827 RepID=A0A0N5D3G1_THECL|nr:unnamed protein product [Thelazia callipaeda]
MDGFFDLVTKMLMSVHPVITHRCRSRMSAVLYDEESGSVYVESGVRYLLYYTDDEDSHMISFSEQFLRKEIYLKTHNFACRALIVSGEGNFASLIVKNKFNL